MSEIIVAKAGGTSNRDAEAVTQSLEWAETSDIFVVSAPGKIGDGAKVTDMLLGSHATYRQSGEVPFDLLSGITERYAAIVEGLGHRAMSGTWVDNIATRVQEAARTGEHAASMLGERLQAEIYQGQGFTLLDPSRSPHDLGSNPEMWRKWLEDAFESGKRYVLPGNTTLHKGHLVTFSRGGSDTSGGLAAYGVEADLNLNLTDDSALSADPRLIKPNERLVRLEHLLYEEGRELGRNGTGLVHPAAMVPLMIGNIPTEIRSTFDREASPTVLDNDVERAARRGGKVVALSLMEDVVIHRVHEPGMAEAYGRLAAFETALAQEKIPVVDSQGDGVDAQKYIVEAGHADQALDVLTEATSGRVETSNPLSLITLVGHRLDLRLLDNLMHLRFNSGMDPEMWQSQGHDLTIGRNSLRLSVDPGEALETLSSMHRSFIEERGQESSTRPTETE